MEDDIIREVLESLENNDPIGDAALRIEENHSPVPISKGNFHRIPQKEFSGRISFIDGGNSEIFGAANFSLQLVRIAEVSYSGRKKSISKEEFYLFIRCKEGKFSIRTFPEGKLEEFTLDSLDSNLVPSGQRAGADSIAGICRRIAELDASLKSKSDIILIDGDLYSKHPLEQALLNKLEKKEDIVAGLSKTSGLMTKSGALFSASISGMDEGAWLYSPVFRNGKVKVSFARFHPFAKHVFRLDTFSEADAEEISSALVLLSSDPVFPGYPYGLIEADRVARVSNREKEILRTKFMTKFGNSWESVKATLRSRDAHEILDNIG